MLTRTRVTFIYVRVTSGAGPTDVTLTSIGAHGILRCKDMKDKLSCACVTDKETCPIQTECKDMKDKLSCACVTDKETCLLQTLLMIRWSNIQLK